MPEPASSITAGVLVKHATMAVLGGFAHAINKHRNGESKGIVDLIALTILSSFFGLLFGFLSLYLFGRNEYLTLAFAGTGGWLGIEGVGIILGIIKKLLP